jgi:hypothetical protein
MELFIPSLIVLILGALFCLVLLPRLSPYVLGGLAVCMFFLGLWQHYSMFPYEYRTSMVTDLLKQYSGFIMLIAVILAGTTAILMRHGGNPPDTADVIPEIPAISEITEQAANIFNLSGNNSNAKPVNNSAAKPANNNASKQGMMGTVTNAMNVVKNAIKPNNNVKKNNLASASFKSV